MANRNLQHKPETVVYCASCGQPWPCDHYMIGNILDWLCRALLRRQEVINDIAVSDNPKH